MMSFWWRHQITSLKYVIKVTSQNFSIFKPPLAKSWLRAWSRAHLNGSLHKSDYLFWRNTYFRKNTYFSENFRTFSDEKALSRSPLGPPVPLNANYRTKQLRWLATVGMFFAKRVLLEQTVKHLLHHMRKSKGGGGGPVLLLIIFLSVKQTEQFLICFVVLNWNLISLYFCLYFFMHFIIRVNQKALFCFMRSPTSDLWSPPKKRKVIHETSTIQTTTKHSTVLYLMKLR